MGAFKSAGVEGITLPRQPKKGNNDGRKKNSFNRKGGRLQGVTIHDVKGIAVTPYAGEKVFPRKPTPPKKRGGQTLKPS